MCNTKCDIKITDEVMVGGYSGPWRVLHIHRNYAWCIQASTEIGTIWNLDALTKYEKPLEVGDDVTWNGVGGKYRVLAVVAEKKAWIESYNGGQHIANLSQLKRFGT
jgi:hypothetical protein